MLLSQRSSMKERGYLEFSVKLQAATEQFVEIER